MEKNIVLLSWSLLPCLIGNRCWETAAKGLLKSEGGHILQSCIKQMLVAFIWFKERWVVILPNFEEKKFFESCIVTVKFAGCKSSTISSWYAGSWCWWPSGKYFLVLMLITTKLIWLGCLYRSHPHESKLFYACMIYCRWPVLGLYPLLCMCTIFGMCCSHEIHTTIHGLPTFVPFLSYS